METFKQDVMYGLRLLWKRPGFTLVAVLTLALGVGANTAIFSIVSWLMLRPLPAPAPEQLVVLAFQQRHDIPGLDAQFSVPEYRAIRDQAAAQFAGIAAYEMSLDGFSFGGRAERVMTCYVTGNFFSTLGLQPSAGRLLSGNEGEQVGADPVVVLGYRYWKNHFGNDAGVVGRKLLINGRPFTVVGVGPKGFHGPYSVLEAEAYLPLGMNVIEGTPADFMENRGYRVLTLLGRLGSGTGLAQARAAAALIGKRLGELYPESDKDIQLHVFPEVRSRPQPSGDNTLVMVSALFLGLAAMVLLLACLNVGNILLVRASARAREMAVRAALGATRIRLVRQLLTESLVLALGGGAAGILLGMWGSRSLGSIDVQTDLPVTFDFAFDWHVFAYAFGAALLTAVAVGIVPAMRASRSDLNTVLHQGGRAVMGGGGKLRTALVVAQVAGSLTLLIIAGLFTRSLQAAQRTNLGFDPTHLVNFYMDPTEIGYKAAQTREFYRQLLSRVRGMPGVESATSANCAPMGYTNAGDSLTIEGYSVAPGQPQPASQFLIINSDYFQTLRIPLMNGRAFTEADNDSANYVAIVNRAWADKYWPKQETLGRRFKLAIDTKHWITIVGVAANARYNGASGPMKPLFYVPFGQHQDIAPLQSLEVRTTGDPAAMIPQLERAIAELAPDLPVFDVKTMMQGLNTLNGLGFYRLGAAFAAILGALGLVLSIVGVYGVISYSTSQRTQEIGIRMALGAQRSSILWMMLRQGAITVGAGMVLGIGAALGAAKLTGQFLAVSPTDPLTYVVVSATLATVAMTACFIPARRSTVVDPVIALRYE